jgi:catechol 2,3-dioxygenase-like lactoylglutathione lyase family enzyme
VAERPRGSELAAPSGSRLHHVGIICPDRAQVESLMALLRLEVSNETYVPAYEADCIFSKGPGGCIEFIIPRGGKLKNFNKGAGGLHHIALEVDDLAAESERLAAAGVRLLEQAPVDAGDIIINFVPPIFTRGVILELVQRRGAAAPEGAAPPVGAP